MSEIAGPTKPLPFAGAIVGEIGAGGTKIKRPPPQAPKKLRPRHKIVLTLVECGWKQSEIAAHVGYTESRVSIICSSKRPDIVAYRESIAKKVLEQTLDVTGILKAAAPKAAMTLILQLGSNDEKVQAVAAKDILDRAGYSPVRKQASVVAPVPVEALEAVLGKIDEANEVVLNKDQWRIVKPTQKEA